MLGGLWITSRMPSPCGEEVFDGIIFFPLIVYTASTSATAAGCDFVANTGCSCPAKVRSIASDVVCNG